MRVGDGEPISRRRNPRGQNDLGFTERFAKSGKAEEGWGRSPGVPLRRLCVTDGIGARRQGLLPLQRPEAGANRRPPKRNALGESRGA